MTIFQKRILYFGHFSASFNNMLYGFFAVYLAPVFFPNIDGSTSVFLSFMVFAAGFMARPIGAVYWGQWGDKYGRREPLTLTMFLISVPVLLIGLLPSYGSIGIVAPILLVAAKIIQGFLYGGEYVGVGLSVFESNEKTESGKNNASIISMGFYGALLGTILGSIATIKGLPEWVWRLPFVFGAISSGVVFFFRNEIKETNDYIEGGQGCFSNLYQKIKENKWIFLSSIVLSGFPTVPLYITIIFGNVLFQEAGMTQSQGMLIGAYILLISGLFIMLFGKISDKIGHFRLLLIAIISNVFISFLMFHTLSANATFLKLFIFITIFNIFSSMVASCYMPYIFSFFKVKGRYSMVAVAVAVGECFIGGITPMLVLKLHSFSNDIFYVYLWVFTVSICSLIAVLYLKYHKSAKQGANNA